MAATSASEAFRWRSSSVMVLVAAAASLSLNDFLLFPVQAAEHGGGAFVLLYMLFLLLLGAPLLVAEIMLGKASRVDPPRLASALQLSPRAVSYWKLISQLMLIAAVVVLSVYSIIGGWAMAYLVRAGAGVFLGINAQGAAAIFKQFHSSTEVMMLWLTLFLLACFVLLQQPARRQLEKALLWIMPAMLVLLLIGLVFSLIQGDFSRAAQFILYPDFARIDSQTVLLALQRAFYTLTLGLGVMMMIGSHMPESASVVRVSLQIIGLDLVLSLITGLSVNALLFAAELEPQMGNQVAFSILPVVFGSVSYGSLFGALFYLLLLLAALSSTVLLMEAPIQWLMRCYDYSRARAVMLMCLVSGVIGLLGILSYTLWVNDTFSLTVDIGSQVYRVVHDATLQDVLIYLASNLLQPLVGLAICLYAGWLLSRTQTHQWLGLQNQHWYEFWNFMIRYVTPTLVLVVFFSSSGLIG